MTRSKLYRFKSRGLVRSWRGCLAPDAYSLPIQLILSNQPILADRQIFLSGTGWRLAAGKPGFGPLEDRLGVFKQPIEVTLERRLLDPVEHTALGSGHMRADFFEQGAALGGQHRERNARILRIDVALHETLLFELADRAADPRLVDMGAPGDLADRDAVGTVERVEDAQIGAAQAPRLLDPDLRKARRRLRTSERIRTPTLSSNVSGFGAVT